jgi:hypothetical protein
MTHIVPEGLNTKTVGEGAKAKGLDGLDTRYLAGTSYYDNITDLVTI